MAEHICYTKCQNPKKGKPLHFIHSYVTFIHVIRDEILLLPIICLSTFEMSENLITTKLTEKKERQRYTLNSYLPPQTDHIFLSF